VGSQINNKREDKFGKNHPAVKNPIQKWARVPLHDRPDLFVKSIRTRPGQALSVTGSQRLAVEDVRRPEERPATGLKREKTLRFSADAAVQTFKRGAAKRKRSFRTEEQTV